MLESIRKGYWRASSETQRDLATLHAELTSQYGASGSYESTGNKELRRFVANLLPSELAADYRNQVEYAVEAPTSLVDGLTLTEVIEEANERVEPRAVDDDAWAIGWFALVAAIFAFLSGLCAPSSRASTD